jgi:hypothetical protein
MQREEEVHKEGRKMRGKGKLEGEKGRRGGLKEVLERDGGKGRRRGQRGEYKRKGGEE